MEQTYGLGKAISTICGYL